jgi:hypothetical protein
MTTASYFSTQRSALDPVALPTVSRPSVAAYDADGRAFHCSPSFYPRFFIQLFPLDDFARPAKVIRRTVTVSSPSRRFNGGSFSRSSTRLYFLADKVARSLLIFVLNQSRRTGQYTSPQRLRLSLSTSHSATTSAQTGFPPPLPSRRLASRDRLFVFLPMHKKEVLVPTRPARSVEDGKRERGRRRRQVVRTAREQRRGCSTTSRSRSRGSRASDGSVTAYDLVC